MHHKIADWYWDAMQRAYQIGGFWGKSAAYTLYFVPIIIFAGIFGGLLIYFTKVMAVLACVAAAFFIINAIRFLIYNPEYANPNATSKTVPDGHTSRTRKDAYVVVETGDIRDEHFESEKDRLYRRRTAEKINKVNDADYDPQTYPREF